MLHAVHLLRHGEVANPEHIVYASLPGFGLSESGFHQARAAAARLSERPIVAVYASPLRRARQTAAFVAERFDLGVMIRPELTEFALSQRWKGLRWEDLPRVLPGELEAYLEHPTRMPFSPESVEVLAARMADAVRRVAARHPDGEAVVVSHQDPIQAARLALTGRPLDRLRQSAPTHCSVISLAPGEPWVELDYWEPPPG